MAPRSIRTLVVDDEQPARALICGMLADDVEIEIIGQCNSGRQALRVLQSESVDLLFLDIQMPSMDGLSMLKQVDPQRMPTVVFVTAHDEYALKAFELHALDYLLKPFTRKRFVEALARAKKRIQSDQVSAAAGRLVELLGEEGDGEADGSFVKEFSIKSGPRLLRVATSQIDRIESDDHYSRAFVNGKSHLLHDSIGQLEGKLDSSRFVRIHRTTIVNREFVAEVRRDPRGGYNVVMRDGTSHRVSRSRQRVVPRLIPGEQ